MFEEERAKAEAENAEFQSDRDVAYLESVTREQSKVIGGTIDFIPVSTERDPQSDRFETVGFDPLDGDILNPEFHGGGTDRDERRLSMRCLIEHEPPKQMLKKYGVDEQREIAFYIPFTILQEEGLVNEWRIHGADIGDLIVWDGSWYQIWNAYRDHYHGQRNRAFFIACFCNRFRHDSVPIEDTPDC